MSRPIIIVAGEEREMTDAEFAQYQIDKAKTEQIAKAEEDKAIAKATAEAKLAGLGLTTEDLKALGL